MVHTLLEYAKGESDPIKRSIIELFPKSSDILGAIPFKTAPGGRYGYQREGALPTNMGFRALNETPSEGHGLINDLTEQCFPIAGNIDVDRALVRRHGMDRRSTEEEMSIKKKAAVWTDTFITGDNASEPREFSGLKTRLQAVGGVVDGSDYESRLIANATASGGGALSLAKLDIAIGLVNNPTHIIMPKAIFDKFGAAQRSTSVSGYITWDKDEWGQRGMQYNNLPVLTGYGITKHGPFMNFDEVAYGGGSAVTSSIYVVSFSEMGVCGLETAPMEVTDMGLLENGVHMRTNVEHDIGLCIEDPYAAIRLSSITNAAITA